MPMSVVLNLTHLWRSQPVITVAEYLRLHDLSPDLELGDGQWDTKIPPEPECLRHPACTECPFTSEF
ncbi:hypothetical protein HD554DRAFT_2094680 [Boletus coccyginus]|nr:hypothetical protein HD554DRAFT_2094680 [Boletus coccyginus]